MSEGFIQVIGVCIGKTALKAKEYGIRHFISDEQQLLVLLVKFWRYVMKEVTPEENKT